MKRSVANPPRMRSRVVGSVPVPVPVPVLVLVLCCLCADTMAGVVSELRLDEVSWNGTSGEIIDSIGSLNGTAAIGSTTSSSGLVCRAGDFSADSVVDYAVLNASMLDGLEKFTLSVWLKTSNSGEQAIVSGANSSQDNEALMFFSNATTFSPYIKGSRQGDISVPAINDNTWHHLVWTRGELNSCVYFDGNLAGCVSNIKSVVTIDPGGLILAQDQDSLGGSFDPTQDFEGLLDELVVFDGEITGAEVTSIYNNGLAGLSWDGIARSCPQLAASWRFEEKTWDGSAGEVLDSSGNGVDATSFNGPVTRETNPALVGSPGTCRYGEFDGIDDYVEIPHNAILNGDNGLTYTAWINPSTWSGSIRQIMAKSVHGGGSGRAQMGIFSEGGVLKGRAETNAGRVETTTSLPMVNQWSHVALVFAGDSLTLYVNGIPAPAATFSNRLLIPTTDPLEISKRVGTSQYFFAGLIDEVRVYDGSLDQASVQAIMNDTHPCETPPVADWRFDASVWNGSTDEVRDSSGNAHHGVAFNTSTTLGKVCNAADLSANSVSDYLSMDASALNGSADFTLMTWYKSFNSGPTALLSGARSAQDNEALFWLPTSTGFNAYLAGNPGANVNHTNVADGLWHLLAWTRSGSNNCLYVDDVLQGCVVNTGGPVSIDPGGLILGQEQDSVGGSFEIDQDVEGQLDEFLIFDRALTQSQLADIRTNHLAGLTWNGQARSCASAGVAEFLINHDGYGIHCLAETLSVTALDATRTVVPGYGGQVTLDTQTGNGSWSLVSGNGLLTDATPDDGIATYQFSALDNGSASFALSYTQGVTPFDIDVYQSDDVTLRDDDSEGLMRFAPSGFTLTANPLSNPPPNPIFDPIATQVAGTAFNLSITAYGQTPTDTQCGVIESYGGARNLKFWQDHIDPLTGTVTATVDATSIAASEGAASIQAVTFSAGQATVSIRYKDVGRIRINLKDNSSFPDPIQGASNSFVVRPANLLVSRVETLSGTPNPGASSATGPGFVSAGSFFAVDIDAVDSEGSLTPNFGREIVSEGVSLESGALVLPATGRNGSAGDGSLIGAFSFTSSATPGRFASSSIGFDEVGIVQLRARLADADYLGSGDLVGTLSGNVGRFFPASYALAGPATVTPACGNFTYLDQPALSLVYSLQALNSAGNVTWNYDESLLGSSAVATVIHVAEDANRGVNMGGRIGGITPLWVNGRIDINAGTVWFGRLAGLDGPYSSTQLGLSVTDALDGVSLSGRNMNASSTGDCVLAGNCDAVQLGLPSQFLYGRMQLKPAFGPETSDLDIGLEAQFYNGALFARNLLDSCSSYAAANTSLGGWQGNLNSGETAVISPVVSTPLSGGQIDSVSPLLLSAPGLGNEGAVDVTLDVPSWLEFDWNAGGDADPVGTARFGRYRGHDRIIYWREMP